MAGSSHPSVSPGVPQPPDALLGISGLNINPSPPPVSHTTASTSRPPAKRVRKFYPPVLLRTEESILAYEASVANDALKESDKPTVVHHALPVPPALLPPPPPPPPPPSPPQWNNRGKQTINQSLRTPAPFQKNRVRGSCSNDGGSRGGVWKWQPKDVKKNSPDDDEKKPMSTGGEARRWKNKHGDYHEILPLNPKDNATSVMIRNIPNGYTRKLLLQTLDDHCKTENEKLKTDEDESSISAYDFVYLPIDFNRGENAGFGFVNFTNPKAALRFQDAFQGKRWAMFWSHKVAEIAKARIQGKKNLIEHLGRMHFYRHSEEHLPVWFDLPRDGSGLYESKMNTIGKVLRPRKKSDKLD